MHKKPAKIAHILQQLYPQPRSELNFDNEFQLVVAVALSAQCTDKKVNQVTPILFKQFRNFKALSNAKVSSIEEIIRPINYYRTKSKNIIELSKVVDRNHNGSLPRNYEELIELPGVGRKTANVVLGELGVAHTLPVDTHVFRVARRLGLAVGTKPETVEQELQAIFPSEQWRNLHHQLIFHGRRVCIAQRPKCNECKLLKLCEFGAKVIQEMKR